ncbi:MAG: tail fiber domain-containing protein [bacterium]|nr:tail fiber domain-containing protein [bacterium]
MNRQHLNGFILGITISICLLSVSILFAWTEPTLNPPQGNISGPINISNKGQSKAGGLILNTGGAATGLVVAKGNVGIGITNPIYKLDVNGQVHASGDICTDVAGGKCLSSAVGSQWITSGKNIYYNSGNVGIGTAGTGYKLDVVGSVGADAFYYRSDINLKKDVEKLDIDNILGKISQIQGVKYSFKEDDQEQIGLIAQEVEKLFPEVVVTKNKIKSIDLKGLVTILIEGVKEQQREIDVLREEVEILKEKR